VQQERRGVVAALVEDAVDEDRRCASHELRGIAARDVTHDPGADLVAGAVVIEAVEVQTELARIRAEVVVFESLLPVEEEAVHLPEATLLGRCLRRGRGSERMRMDLS
jgi:hypothetical protein